MQVTGSRLVWFQPWVLKYALLHSAIIVAPDYRLMPEANGLEILQDVADLWDWVYTKLQPSVGSGIELDMNKIMIEGDSAGLFELLETWVHIWRLTTSCRWLPCNTICSYSREQGCSNDSCLPTDRSKDTILYGAL
jgi:hypothetical protein